MAVITLQGGLNMGRALALCNHIVMTTTAGTNDITVINSTGSHRRPGCWSRLMTGITGVGGIDVAGTLATGDGSIVTTETGTDDFVVVNRRCSNRCPGCREHGMTGIAVIGCINMGRILAAGCRSIVPGKTVIDETGVINRRYL